jgi:hypothetical protein
MSVDKQQTAVEWLISDLISKGLLTLNGDTLKSIGKAKEMDKEQKIKAQIEILYSIGNNGANAPLYGILKTTLLDLQEQLKQQNNENTN